MSHSKAICPKCLAEVMVDASDDASICKRCGAPFITAKAIEAFLSSTHETENTGSDSDGFPYPYRITIEREMNPVVRDSVTFLMILNGRPRPLANGAVTVIQCDKKCFEIPVYISKNSRNKFEGVLTGIADGNDIHILWDADPKLKTLGQIKETTNHTVSFQEKPGATRW